MLEKKFFFSISVFQFRVQALEQFPVIEISKNYEIVTFIVTVTSLCYPTSLWPRFRYEFQRRPLPTRDNIFFWKYSKDALKRIWNKDTFTYNLFTHIKEMPEIKMDSNFVSLSKSQGFLRDICCRLRLFTWGCYLCITFLNL